MKKSEIYNKFNELVNLGLTEQEIVIELLRLGFEEREIKKVIATYSLTAPRNVTDAVLYACKLIRESRKMIKPKACFSMGI